MAFRWFILTLLSFGLLAHAQPSNDLFANRLTIDSANYTWIGDNFGASLEPGETPAYYGSPEVLGSLWWTWTAPTNGKLTIDGTGSQTWLAIAVYIGTNLTGLTGVLTNFGYETPIPFIAIAGQTYQIAVTTPYGPHTIALKATFVPSPPNDDFANRMPISGRSNDIFGTIAGATVEPGESVNHRDSVWYRWRPPASGTATLKFNQYGVQAWIYKGDSLTNLTLWYPQGAWQGIVWDWFRVEKDTDYVVVVSRNLVYPPGDDFSMSLFVDPSPPNDSFEKATIVSGATNLLNSTFLNATDDPGQPLPSNASLWWRWKAPANGLAILGNYKRYSGSTYAAVFTGNSISNLNTVVANTHLNPQESLPFRVQAGLEYVICLNGNPSTTPWNLYDSVQAQLSFLPNPPNDNFSNRSVLTGLTNHVQAINLAATGEPNEPSANGTPTNTVWYTWTAPSGGFVNFTLRTDYASEYRLTLFTNNGTGVSTVAASAQLSSQFPSVLSTKVHAGTTYDIQVSGLTTLGIFELRWDLVVGPSNDDFADRIVLSNSVPSYSTLSNATLEPNEQYTGSSKTIWYSWTPSSNCQAMVTVTGQSGMPKFDVFTGPKIDQLSQKISSWSGFDSFIAEAGVHYSIAVGSPYNTEPGRASITISTEPLPPNDQFTNRIILPANDPHYLGQIFGATREVGEPIHGNAAEYSVWFSWTSPSNGVASISLFTSNWWPTLLIYKGDNLTNLTALSTNSFIYSSVTNVANFAVTVGERYEFALVASYRTAGPYSLSIDLEPEPLLNWVGSTNIVATPGGGASVTLDVSQLPLITRIDLYEGTNFLSSMASEPFTFALTNLQLGRRFLRAVAIDENGTKWISGPMTIRTPPSNDDFSNRIRFESIATAPDGALAGASGELNESLPSTQGSLWWSWIAPSNGTFVVTESIGPAAYPILVYAVDSSAGQTLAASYDMGGVFRAQAGKEYAFVVRGSTSAQGPITLVVQPAAPNDDFVNRTHLSGLSNVMVSTSWNTSRETNEPPHSSIYQNRTLWWTWTAPAGGAAFIWSDFVPVFTSIYIYRGSELLTLQVVTNLNGGGGRGQQSFPVTNGEQFEIVMVSGANTTMPFIAHLDFLNVGTNDNFATATRLYGATNVVTGSNLGASREPGEPLWRYGKSLWWSWTAPRGAEAIVQVSADFSHNITVSTGATISALTSIVSGYSSFNSNSNVHFPATAGVTYLLQLDSSYPSFGGSFELRMLQPNPPANDMYTNAIILSGYPSNVVGGTLNATSENIDSAANLFYTSTVWWQWTPPEQRTVTFIGPASSYQFLIFENYVSQQTIVSRRNGDTFLARTNRTYYFLLAQDTGNVAPFSFSVVPNVSPSVSITSPRNGESFAPGAPFFISVNASDPDGSIREVLLNSTPFSGRLTNSPYEIQVNAPTQLGTHSISAQVTDDKGSWQWSDNITFNVSNPNDFFAGAPLLTGLRPSVEGNTTGANQEPGEPAIGNSIWWHWTAPKNGIFVVNTVGSLIETMLWIYQGPNVSNLVLITKNDDLNWHDSRSEARFTATEGETYHIAVAGQGGAMGAVKLSIAPVPVNDDFAMAQIISNIPWTTAHDNLGASLEPAEPVHSSGIGGRSLWWKWTATQSGTVTMSAAESDIDTVIAVYTGNSVSTLVKIASDDDSGFARNGIVEFNAVPGTIYYVAVDSYDGSAGTVRLTVGPSQAPALLTSHKVGDNFEFEAFGTAGRVVRLESSTNLFDWTPVETNLNPSGLIRIVKPMAGHAQEFFRVSEQ